MAQGIYNNLVESFDLEALAAIRSREEFAKMLPVMSQASRKYFSLSSHYFDTGQDGAVQMIGDLKTFSNPDLVGGFALTIEAPEISFSSWVRISQDFIGGYLLRKRPASAGVSSSRSCWGWYLDRKHGQALHYGAHDFFATSAEMRRMRAEQVEIRLREPTEVREGEYSMLTMIINGTHVSFFMNMQELGSRPMPRALTDCSNGGEGILLGDSGLTIGQLRFHPRALSRANIQELIQYGATFEDISTGSEPHDVAMIALAGILSLSPPPALPFPLSYSH